MGINGLLQQLKSISRPTHVSAYRGQKVAIDGYSWLHKGAYSCSRELCEGVWADGYVRYFVSRIDMLLGNGVIPVVVFDGCRLPMKADEEDSRRRGRREALERARAHAESGNMAAANECYQRAVDIAPWMAKVVLEALRERDVTCLVAPYEADAQMSYLALRGDVYAVLTEDSDMLAYGCPRVLYKLDRAGTGEEVVLSDLPLVRELNMAGFDHDMLLQMCILAGCDFLPNMSGVGIKKAHAMIRKHRDFVKVVRYLRFNGSSPPPGYEVRFQRTIWLFRHQRVFCPHARALTHLRPLPAGGLGAADVLVLAALPPEGHERDALPFLGPPIEADVAAGIAAGDIDPSTLQPFDLPAIYRGCNYPPRHLRALLPPPPNAAQQHGSQSQGGGGGGGSQRRLSWGGGGSSQGQGSQHHQHHSQQQQQQGRYGRPAGRPPVAPKDRIDRYFFAPNPAASQPFRSHALRVDGSGGCGDGSGVGQRSGSGYGSAAVSSGGGGGAPPPVVTLTGLPVETAEARAVGGGGGGGCAAGAAAAASAEADGLAEGAGPGGRSESSGDGHADDQDAECSMPPSAKRRRLGGGYRAARGLTPAAEAGGTSTAAGLTPSGPGPSAAGGSSSGGSLFARFRRSAEAAGHRACAAGPSSCSQSQAAFGDIQGDGEPTGAPDALEEALACGGGAGNRAEAVGAEAAVAAAGDCCYGGGGAGPSGAAPGSQFAGPQSQGLTRAWSFGALSDGLGATRGHPPSGTASEFDSQLYGSQYDSQLTSGCEGAGWPAWRGGSGSAGGGGGLVGGRSRAPARLALEALFSEPSGGSAAPSQSAPLCGGGGLGDSGAPAPYATGPAAGLGGGVGAGPGRQVRGALAAFHCWRQAGGPLVLGVAEATAATATGTAGGSQPLCSAGASLQSPAKHAHMDPPPHRDPGWHPDGCTVPERDLLGLDGAQPGAHRTDRGPPQENHHQQQHHIGAGAGTAAPAVSAATGGGPARLGKPPPPQFSIYELDESELHHDLEPAPGLVGRSAGGLGSGRGEPPAPVGAAGKRHRYAPDSALHAGSDDDDDGGGEAEVTSPWKDPRAAQGRPRLPVHRSPQRNLSSVPGGAPIRRRGLLHPSARRHLSAGQRLEGATTAQGDDLGCPGPEPEPGAGPEPEAGVCGAGMGLSPARGDGRRRTPGCGFQQLGAADDSEQGLIFGVQGAGAPVAGAEGGCDEARGPDGSGSDDPDVRAFKRALERSDAQQRRQRRRRSAPLCGQGLLPRPGRSAGEQVSGGELGLRQEGAEGCDDLCGPGPDRPGGAAGTADCGGAEDGGGGALEFPAGAEEEPGATARGTSCAEGHQPCADGVGIPREADPAVPAAVQAAPAQAGQVPETGGGGGDGAGGRAPDMEDDDDDQEVLITAEIRVGGGGGGCAADAGAGGGGVSACFHSVEHMARFALVAQRALDNLQRSLPPLPSEPGAGGAGRPDPSLRTQPQPQSQPHRRASLDGTGSGGRAPAAAARPLTDFAFLRSAPKRRSGGFTAPGRAGGAGAGLLGGTPVPAARAGSCRPSVFVRPLDVDTGGDVQDANARPPSEATPGCSAVSPVVTSGGLRATHGPAGGGARHALGRRGGGEDSGCGGEGSGLEGAPEREDSDGSDDVVIVGEADGPAGGRGGGAGAGGRPGVAQHSGGSGGPPARRVLADMMLRRPFQAPRSNAGGAGGGGAWAASGGGGKGKGVAGFRGAGKESQQPQQQRITAFQRYEFAGSK